MTVSDHGDLPDEQGIANAPAETCSDPKIATGPDESGSGPKTAIDLAETPSESERDATDSGQKIAIGPIAIARGRTANETSSVDDALDCLTASGKRSKSEVDESWLYNPSLFLDPKIGKHRRIANGSGPPKTLPTHHVAERAVMSWERQPRKQSGQGESAANKHLPPPQLPKEPRRQKHLGVLDFRRSTRTGRSLRRWGNRARRASTFCIGSFLCK